MCAVYTCKLAEEEHPLFLRLVAGPSTDTLSFVLKEQQTGEVMVRFLYILQPVRSLRCSGIQWGKNHRENILTDILIYLGQLMNILGLPKIGLVTSLVFSGMCLTLKY